ncbi:MAG: L,D-transpeptidase family protein, partial [Pseudomonadota bacterium]
MFVAHANRWLTARRGLAVAVAALTIGIQVPSADAAKRKKLSKPAQPMTLVVDLARQRVTGYAGAERIWSSRISSGKRGHRTPTGVFSIIQKRSRHFSNIYNNAPMPHMQRITWSGIAFHGGPIPGYPASHGCIRLPYGQARRLFRLTRMQTRAIVTYSSPRPTLISHANLWNKLPVGSDPEPSDPSDPPVERVPETAPGADDAPVATTGRTVERQTARLLNSVVGGGAAGQPVTNIAARIDGAAVGDDGRDAGDSASREVAVVGPPTTQKEARRRLEAALAGHRSRVTVAESRVRLAKAIVKAHGTKLLTLNKRRRQTIRALAKAKRLARRSERSAKRVKAAMTRLLKANVKIDPETDTFADLAVREAALEERLDRSEADLRISNAEVAELTGTLGRIDDEREIMKPKLASARLEFR